MVSPRAFVTLKEVTQREEPSSFYTDEDSLVYPGQVYDMAGQGSVPLSKWETANTVMVTNFKASHL